MTDPNQDPEEEEVSKEETDNVVHDDLLADEDGDVDNLVEDRDYTAPA